MKSKRIEQLTKDGFRPVALLCLYDANVIIRPGAASDDLAGWLEFPETTPTISLVGRELAQLAEAFRIDLQPFTIKSRPGKPDRYQDLGATEFYPIQRTMEQQKEGPNPIRRLYAREDPAGTLKLAAEHSGDGLWRFSTYLGRYELHWDYFTGEGNDNA